MLASITRALECKAFTHGYPTHVIIEQYLKVPRYLTISPHNQHDPSTCTIDYTLYQVREEEEEEEAY